MTILVPNVTLLMITKELGDTYGNKNRQTANGRRYQSKTWS